MVLVSATPSYGSVKRYWRRRQYERLSVSRPHIQVIRLGGKRKRSWNIKVIRRLRLRFKLASPIKLLAKLRDAYINMMLGLARAKDRKVSKVEDIENKLILEICKSLKASRELSYS